MELTAIQGLVTSLKTVADLAKTIVNMKVTGEVQSKVIEIQSTLLTAQNNALSANAAQFELLEKVRELESQLKEFNDWEAQKDRYSLVAPWRGPAQVYALKKEKARGENPHLLCANCFHSSKKVILNPLRKDGNMLMECPFCKATLDTDHRHISQARYAEHYAEKK